MSTKLIIMKIRNPFELLLAVLYRRGYDFSSFSMTQLKWVGTWSPTYC